MPTNAVGVLVFVALFAPGACFVLRRERARPSRSVSAFRETVALALMSVACDAIVLAGFGISHLRYKGGTPDLDLLVRTPHDYVINHPAEIAVWSSGLLLLAALIGLWLGGPTAAAFGRWLVRSWRWLFRRREPDYSHAASAWWMAFHLHENLDPVPSATDRKYHVSCLLEDGSVITGVCASYSPDADETPDRELLLKPPITYRAPGVRTALPWDVDLFALSARRLVGMAVSLVVSAPKSNAETPR
jgi:hypothetical protein